MADLRAGLAHPRHLGTEPRPNIAVLDRALRSEQRFQVPPEAPEIHPNPKTTLPDVSVHWKQTRTELTQLLHQLTPESALGGVFCHPFAGWMTFGAVLDHFSAHLVHHGYQLARLRASFAHLQA